jgi:hypothetical protein
MFFLFLIIKKKKNIIKFLKLNNLGKALFVYIKKLAKGKIGMEKK